MADAVKKYGSWALWIAGFLWALWVCDRFYDVSPFPKSFFFNQILPPNLDIFPTLSALWFYLGGFVSSLSILISVWVLGQMALSRWSFAWASSLERTVFSVAVGYGVLSIGTAVLGGAQLYYKSVFIGLHVILFCLAVAWFRRPEERQALKNAWGELKKILFSGGWSLFLTTFLALILLVDFVMVFVPELFYDALVYHLGVTKFYLHENGFSQINLLPEKFPLAIQMIHLNGIALHSEIASKFHHFFMMVLCVAGLLVFSKRVGRQYMGLLAALAFVSIPTVQMNAWSSGVDLGVTFFGLYAALACFMALEGEEQFKPWFLLSAFYAGLCLSSKYTAAVVPTVIVLTATTVSLKRGVSFKLTFQRMVMFSAVVFALMSPWLIKNWVFSGNPVYPFLSDILGGDPIADFRYEHLRFENRGFTPKNAADFFRLPWVLSITERSSLGFHGPLYLASIFFVLLAFINDRPRWLKWLVFYSVLYAVIGLTMTRLTRYLMPGICVASLLVGYAFESLILGPNHLKRWASLLVFVVAVYQQISWASIIIKNSYAPHQVLLGKVPRDKYMGSYHPGMNPNPANPMFSYIEKNLKHDEKVLLVGDEKVFPLNHPYLYSGVFDTGPLLTIAKEVSTPKEFAKKLEEQGVTHLLVNLFESKRLAGYGIFEFEVDEFGVFCAFWEMHLRVSHVIRAPLTRGVTNPLILMEVVPDGLKRGETGVQNVLGQFWEESKLKRLKKHTPDDMKAIYKELQEKWPKVLYFKQRLKQLDASSPT